MTLTTSSRPSAEKQAGGLLLSAWKGGFGPFLRVWVPPFPATKFSFGNRTLTMISVW
jgi:hypothetical protein